MANLNLPLLSACTVLKDEEIYNSIDEENDSSIDSNELLFNHQPNEFANPSLNNNNSNSENEIEANKSLDKLLNEWLADANEKWIKIKRDILLRQKREAESLQAIQKLNWQWKSKEGKDLDFYDKSNATNLKDVEDAYVPLVKVIDDLKLPFSN